MAKVAAALVASGVISLWVAGADAALANSARKAASLIRDETHGEASTLWFEGHWGFQYYMESLGARAVDFSRHLIRNGDLVVIPENNIQLVEIEPEMVSSKQTVQLAMPYWATTIRWELGAGFYSSYWGPLPFTIGPVPAERYNIFRIAPVVNTQQ